MKKILNITTSEEGEVPRKSATDDRTSSDVVGGKQSKNVSTEGQDKKEDGIGAEARAPSSSLSHPHSEPCNSRHSSPLTRSTRFTSIFDRLDNEDYSHKRKPCLFEGRRVGSISKDPSYVPDYSYNDKDDGPTRSFELDDDYEDLIFFHEIRSTLIPRSFVRSKF
ncbi:hypothetical protein Fot_06183 [Forsythia ovata]|uniref:Uncharacterized protein n=1 Tax=Forsythia ovata TaxID=205694 RepID=A0ABD1WSD6_9LAMI